MGGGWGRGGSWRINGCDFNSLQIYSEIFIYSVMKFKKKKGERENCNKIFPALRTGHMLLLSSAAVYLILLACLDPAICKALTIL